MDGRRGTGRLSLVDTESVKKPMKPLISEAQPGAKEERFSAPELVRVGLRKAIMSGEIAPGTQLRQDEIASRFGTKIPLYGHAADGNLHAHIMDDVSQEKADAIKLAIYEEGVRLGGKITAEHGVGKIRKEFLPLCLSPKAIELMRAIKGAFDPKGILNPDCALS